jgi:putative sugar O-methyltransferase
VILDPDELNSMVAEVEEADGILTPSQFWVRFAARNTSTLLTEGFESFKRSVNYNYFQWVINSPRQPEFASVFKTWAQRPSPRVLGARVCVDDVDWNRPRAPRQLPVRYRAIGHALYVAMLWDVARRRVRAEVTNRLEESTLGDPIAVSYRGHRISEDLSNSLFEYGSIAECVPEFRLRNATLLEIGAGYGRFADMFLMAQPDARVVVVDIPPALAVSQAYLTARHPDLTTHRFARGIRPRTLAAMIGESRLAFLTPNQFSSLPPLGADLVVNVSSLHEMLPQQISEYLRLIDRHAGGGFFYTKQWTHWFNEIDGVQTDKSIYPYPTAWRCLFDRTPVAQPAFFEALFALTH